MKLVTAAFCTVWALYLIIKALTSEGPKSLMLDAGLFLTISYYLVTE